MKMLFFFFCTVFFFQNSLWAQDNQSGADVCKKIGEFNKPHEIQCAALISKNEIPMAALSLAYKLAQLDTFAAISALKYSINKDFDLEAGKVCEQIAEENTNLAADCAKASAGAFFFSPLARICLDVATTDSFFGLKCIKTIANKISRNGAEKICESTAKTDAAETMRCISQIVSDYYPEEGTIEVSRRELESMRMELYRARHFLRYGDFYRTDFSIGNSIYSIDRILSGN